VLARVHAVLNRTHPQTANVLTYNGLSVDADKKTVSVDGKDVSLTRTEFELLWLLLSHQGEVFSRQQLIDMVWPENVVVTDRAVDVSIARMRKKIGPYSSCVIARMGYGYYFCV
jgi:DNA-binding response OmpR family regulator